MFYSLNIKNGAVYAWVGAANSSITAPDFKVHYGGRLSIQYPNVSLIASTLLIEPTGLVTADAVSFGNVGNAGPTTGASYATRGGASTSSNTFGNLYGSMYLPIGSAGWGSNTPYSTGGGQIILQAGTLLQVEGTVTASATNIYGGSNTGGGTGGAILVMASTMRGSGTLQANGAPGGSNYPYWGGGGAGGRIAIYLSAEDFAFNGVLSVAGGICGGGSSYNSACGGNYEGNQVYSSHGGHGTVYINSLVNSATYQHLILDNLDKSYGYSFALNEVSRVYLDRLSLRNNVNFNLGSTMALTVLDLAGDNSAQVNIAPGYYFEVGGVNVSRTFPAVRYLNLNAGSTTRLSRHSVMRSSCTLSLNGLLVGVENLYLYSTGNSFSGGRTTCFTCTGSTATNWNDYYLFENLVLFGGSSLSIGNAQGVSNLNTRVGATFVTAHSLFEMKYTASVSIYSGSIYALDAHLEARAAVTVSATGSSFASFQSFPLFSATE